MTRIRSKSRAAMARVLGAASLCVALATASAAQTVFPVFLDGGQVVPGSGSEQTGFGHVFLNPVQQTISYDIQISGLTGTFAGAHLQRGGPGEEGSVILALVGGPLSFAGVSSLNPSDIQLLRDSETYVVIRSSAHPAGEIRGQVTPSTNQAYAHLVGSDVVPPSPSAAVGDGVFQILPDRRVSYAVELDGLAGPATVAHLHRGEPGEQGPVIHGLSWTAPGVFSGTTAPLSTLDLAFLRSGRTYVDVHSAQMPGGEVRGQLTTSFAGYLEGCHGPPQGPAQLTGGGITRPGGQVIVGIQGGVPGQGGILFLGAVGADLPFEWGCRLFVGPPWIPLVLPPLGPNGTLTIASDLPPDSPLGWLQMQYFGEQPSAPGGFYSTNGLSLHVSG